MSLLNHINWYVANQYLLWFIAHGWQILFTLIGVLLARRIMQRRDTSRGSAAWMKPRQAGKLFRRKGLLIGDWNRWSMLPVFYDANSNILTCGAPRSAKGVGMLVVNALRWPFMFLYDPGGEISAICVRQWRRRGYNMHFVNPWGMYGLPKSHFNPLDYLDPKSETFSSDALWFASLLVGKKYAGSSAGEYFDDKSSGGYQTLLMFVKDTYSPENQHLGTVRDIIRGDIKEWSEVLVEMKKSRHQAVRGQANEWMMAILQNPKQFDIVKQTMETATKFIDDDIVRAALSKTDARFHDLTGLDATGKRLKGAIVSVIIPLEFKESHGALARMAIGCTVMTMRRNPRVTEEHKVLAMIDEFASIGKISEVISDLANLPKYGILFHLVLHNIGQAKGIYGEHGWGQIVGNCSLRQFLGVQDLETGRYVSDMCGTMTERDARNSIVSRKLIMPEEVMLLRPDQQIVFLPNKPPVLLKIRPYWQRPSLVGTFNDNPYYKGKKSGPPGAWTGMVLLGLILRGIALFPSFRTLAAAAVFIGVFYLWR
ncbi:type IV secretory system conjugative DNA transfer family protein [Roseicella sp. DB1501]|uniref:type IV secretory system conjugative DNA transfer family protein n=1 Tax=Roseicella sp. DB1501 TaxID=2730925 RepID=UPI0014926793|nr:type IV secretory system conjugative DNA transfer family protein [Roseicella sp. DB1501]NOG70472.1 type IV secretory system conjugative DNA transfer family protein [Roseicella sp. DB1501]